MSETIQEIEDQITDEFGMFDDWMQKYEYLIDLGKSLPLIDEEYKTDEYKVKGCQSQVWLKAYVEDGKIVYKADSDAVITKGLIALLIRVLSHQPPDDILKAKLEFINKIGMREHLSPNRANGLVAMIEYMKKYAAFYAHKNASRN